MNTKLLIGTISFLGIAGTGAGTTTTYFLMKNKNKEDEEIKVKVSPKPQDSWEIERINAAREATTEAERIKGRNNCGAPIPNYFDKIRFPDKFSIWSRKNDFYGDCPFTRPVIRNYYR